MDGKRQGQRHTLTKIRQKAQSLLEYGVLFAVVGAAVLSMSLYWRRSIQLVVKVAADEMTRDIVKDNPARGHRQGAIEYDYNLSWKIKGDSAMVSEVDDAITTQKKQGGEVTYGTDKKTKRYGVLSDAFWTEE